nr:kunitz trypsin inhibitor 2-like [Ipomoea batatas]
MFLSFLVFAAITTSVHCTTDPPNPHKQVRDTDGDLVRVETNYYIIPTKKETGGGLSLRSTTDESCPLGIFQEDEDDDESLGIPVTFYPVNPKKNVIRVSTDLNIEFSESPLECDNSNVWKVDNYSGHSKRHYISPDGVKGHPGSNTISNWFKIEEFESGYKLKHCPSVMDNDTYDDGEEDDVEVLCKDVGLHKGKPVRANTSYDIVPIMARTGGGLPLRSTTRKFCPLGIFQEANDDYLGIPISFYPVNLKKGVIRDSTYLSIDFPKNRVQCAKSNVWKVDNYDQYTKSVTMKSTAILFLSFLVFAAITTSVHCTTGSSSPAKQVRDVDGDLVRANTSYYIIPMSVEDGGGFSLRSTKTDESCPLGIFQEDENDENVGIPVTFSLVNPKKSVIRVSTDLNIEFSETPVECDISNVWKVDNYKRHPKRFYISPDGVKGNPGSDTISSWFRIEEFERGYKLIHCPSVMENDDYEGGDEDEIEVLCKDVGLLKYSGQQRLALTDTPLRVVFRKA